MNSNADQKGRIGWPGILSLLVLTAALVGAFLLKSEMLFNGFDGGYMRDMARRQMDWDLPLDRFGPNVLMGLGDLGFTTNFRLFPVYQAASFFGAGDLAKAIAYTVCFAELALAVYLLGRRLALPWLAAWIAAMALPLLSLPLFESAALYPIYGLVPQMATTVAVTTLMGWAYLGLGRGAVLVPAVVFLAGFCFLVFGAIIVMMLTLPVMLIYAIAGLVAAETARERLLKVTALVLGTSFMMAGPAWFLLGLGLNTAPGFFPAELTNDRTSVAFSTMLFHGELYSAAGPGLAGLAIAGAVLSIVRPPAPIVRPLAVGVLIFLASMIGFWASTRLWDWWTGPSPVYFEFYIAPLYTVFAAWAAYRIVARLTGWAAPSVARWQRRQRLASRTLFCGVTVAGGALALGFAAFTKTPPNHFPYPPAATAVTDVLARELAFEPGAPFRGRVATLTGQEIEKPVGWIDLHLRDLQIFGAFANEHRMVGLTHFAIPTLFQYTPSISPGFYAVVSRLLVRPGDRQFRSALAMRRYNRKILAMLGVTAIITDAEMAGAEPIAAAAKGEVGLFAYTVPDPNLGTYAPNRAVRGADATAILAAMADSEFDPRAAVFADLPENMPDTGFSAVSQVRFVVNRTGWHVEAESTGPALLLLPVEYSACLGVEAAGGDPVLIRANLVLTGVVFGGRLDMDLTHLHGPFTKPRCRLKDRDAFRALGLGQIPPLPEAGG